MKFMLLKGDDRLTPTKAQPGDAGWDLRNAGRPLFIDPGERVVIPTGVSVEIPEGMAGFIWPRSGLAVDQGIDVLAGVIDSGYRGEIKVVLINHDSEPVEIYQYDRIAQLVISPIFAGDAEVVDELGKSIRNTNGFGSSGVK